MIWYIYFAWLAGFLPGQLLVTRPKERAINAVVSLALYFLVAVVYMETK